MSNTGDIVRIGVNMFVVRRGELLLGKRKGNNGGGFWGLPGGHLEYNESMEGCARRELQEETGLTAKKLTFLHAVNDSRQYENDRHYVHFCFLAHGVVGESKLMEPEKCYEWRWFDLKKLPKPEEIFVGHCRLIPAYLKKQVFLDARKV